MDSNGCIYKIANILAVSLLLVAGQYGFCSCTIDLLIDTPGASITSWPVISFDSEQDSINAYKRGFLFGSEIQRITDFKKDGDLMTHVPSFCIIDNVVYYTYYANVVSDKEQPDQHIARFVICPLDDVDRKSYFDIQGAIGSGLPAEKTTFDGKQVIQLYDTILLKKDNNTVYIMWTAALDGEYTRLYQSYTITTAEFGPISYNYFEVNGEKSIMNISGIENALNSNNIQHKPLSSDIGIMQKITSRIEGGIKYYYTGCYANKFNCLIKSKDLITWEFVSTPSFDNTSQFENAVFVKDDIAFYFCRQEKKTEGGFLTSYDLNTGRWSDPVLVRDSQSRSDFIEMNGALYLLHAPIDRNHLGLLKVDLYNLNNSKEILIADVPNYFYPYSQIYQDDLYIAFTQSRKRVWLSKCRFPE